ncbi:MAG TPA: HutD family protein [Luteibacter sp.]|uniref:HutD/Ves family protein n=1 Tax=Luteibacter sp. TaxID=1886636 RepID=UPI002CDE02CD|nr:HutD family protein [Luteibacter sp.]HVI57000.1 HutD family protein [Luteibacter sp.]
MTIVPFAELKAVPWKNGLGITREIAVAPPGAPMDSFVWRVSIADVDTASPFSRFPGIDRVIVLLEGDGFTMRLDGGGAHALTTPHAPFAFAGEATVEVRLAGGATRDFNLMVRRDAARGAVKVVQGPATLDIDADTALVYLAQGEALSDGVPVHAGDSVIGAAHVVLAEGATALLARVTPAAR